MGNEAEKGKGRTGLVRQMRQRVRGVGNEAEFVRRVRGQ